MKKVKVFLTLSFIAFVFATFSLFGVDSLKAAPGPGTTDYKRPLAEYQKNGETHYCCKNTQYSSCSSSQLCSDVVHD